MNTTSTAVPVPSDSVTVVLHDADTACTPYETVRDWFGEVDNEAVNVVYMPDRLAGVVNASSAVADDACWSDMANVGDMMVLVAGNRTLGGFYKHPRVCLWAERVADAPADAVWAEPADTVPPNQMSDPEDMWTVALCDTDGGTDTYTDLTPLDFAMDYVDNVLDDADAADCRIADVVGVANVHRMVVSVTADTTWPDPADSGEPLVLVYGTEPVAAGSRFVRNLLWVSDAYRSGLWAAWDDPDDDAAAHPTTHAEAAVPAGARLRTRLRQVTSWLSAVLHARPEVVFPSRK